MAFTKKVDLFDMMTNPDRHYILTVEEFNEDCECGALIDYDGFGHAIDENGYMDTTYDVKPSRRNELPASVTHIEWYNR
jgi:hypothetical protein